MPTPDARLRKYAAFAVAHLVAALVVLAVPMPGWGFGALLVTAIPFLFAWGHYHVDLARNNAVGEAARTRWRSFFYLVPWTVAMYWWLYVRPRPAHD